MKRGLLGGLLHDLEAPIEARGFGTGWFAGFFALVLAIAGLCFVAALRWPDWFAMPQLGAVRDWTGFRVVIHLTLLAAYGLALLSLLLRPRKALGATALVIALIATLLGGAAPAPFRPGHQTAFAHDRGDGLLADLPPRRLQIGPDPWRPVRAAVRGEQPGDLSGQLLTPGGLRRGVAVAPLVEPRLADLQRAARGRERDAVLLPLGDDERGHLYLPIASLTRGRPSA